MHASGCYFAFCDGSVRLVSYDVDPETHRRDAGDSLGRLDLPQSRGGIQPCG